MRQIKKNGHRRHPWMMQKSVKSYPLAIAPAIAIVAGHHQTSLGKEIKKCHSNC